MTKECKYWDSEIKTCRRSEVPKITLPEHIILDDLVSDEFKVVRAIDLPEPKIENRWIPVTERLPKKGEKVMACDIDGDIMLGWMHDRTHLCAVDDYYKNITAWMPLPEPWKGDEE